MKSRDELKQAVATKIQTILPDPELLLFGSGSTVNHVITKFTNRDIVAVSSSLATSLTLSRSSITEIQIYQAMQYHHRVCIDGADLVILPERTIIKGHGGALLREKITWQQATEIIVVIDETKLAEKVTTTIPVVITEFGFRTTISQLEALPVISKAELYRVNDLPYHTDDGNFLVHLTTPPDIELADLDQQLHGIAGVVETGIFLPSDYASISFICGTQDGIEEF